MPASALALALGSAFLHAFWNLLIARAPDIEAATAVALVTGIVVFAPVAVLAWDADAAVWPYLAVTSLLQLAYFIVLTTAYGRATCRSSTRSLAGRRRCSSCSPRSRSSGREPQVRRSSASSPSPPACSSCVASTVGPTLGDLALALTVGACIAAYTLVDSRGIRYASPIVYQELSMIPATIGFGLFVLRRRGRAAVRRAIGPASIAAGLATFGAYILVLAALARAPAASVAAVRETSVVIATAFAVPMLHERVGPARIAGALLVVAGVFLLAL